MRRHLRRWGVVWILLGLFLASWVGQWFAQLAEFTADQAEHGQSFVWSDFLAAFLSATWENWQSEMLQLALQAVLVVGLADRIFTRSTEDMARLTDEVAALRQRLDGH